MTNKSKGLFCLLIFSIALSLTQTFAAIYTWKSTGVYWDDANSWTVTGGTANSAGPQAGDAVSITTTGAVIKFNGSPSSVSIGALTMNNGSTLNFESKAIALTVTGNVSITGSASILGSTGSLGISSASAISVLFSSATIGVPVSINTPANGITFTSNTFSGFVTVVASSSININGSTFSQGVNMTSSNLAPVTNATFGSLGTPKSTETNTFIDNGTTVSNRMWNGGNTYYGKTKFTNLGGAGLHVSYQNNDKAYGDVELRNEGTLVAKTVYGNAGADNLIDGNLTVINNNPNSTIVVSNLAGSFTQINGTITVKGSSTNNVYLSYNGNITHSGNLVLDQFTAGTLNLKKFVQNATSDQTWDFGSGAATLYMESSAFNGTGSTSINVINNAKSHTVLGCTLSTNFTVNSPSCTLNLQNSTFNKAVTVSNSALLYLNNSIFPLGGTFVSALLSDFRLCTLGTSGGTFAAHLTSNGTGSIRQWYGSNNFYGKTTIVNNGPEIRTGNTVADTYNGDLEVVGNTTSNTHISFNTASTLNGNLTVKNNSSGIVIFANQANSKFTVNGNIVLESVATGSVNFGITGSTGAVDHNSGSFTATSFSGTLNLTNFKQITPIGPVNITGSTALTIVNGTFPKGGTFTTSRFANLNTCTFGTNGGAFPTYLTNNSGTGTLNQWYGNNTFYGKTTITNNGVELRTGATAGDTYYGDLEVVSNTTNATQLSFNTVSTVNGNLIVKHNSSGYLSFANQVNSRMIVNGNITLESVATGNVNLGATGFFDHNSGAFTATSFQGTLNTRNFKQTMPTSPVNISGSARLNLQLSNFPKGGTFRSAEVYNIQNCTFGTVGTAYGVQTNTLEDYGTPLTSRNWNGNNVFYGKTIIKNSGGATLVISYSNGNDVVNGDLELRNEGTLSNKTTFANTGTANAVAGKFSLVNNSVGGQFIISPSAGALLTVGGDIEPSGTSSNLTQICRVGTGLQQTGGNLICNNFTAGTLEIYGLVQSAVQAQSCSLNMMGTSNLKLTNATINGNTSITVPTLTVLESCTLKGDVSISSAFVTNLKSSTFGVANASNTISITDNGSSTSLRPWHGNNTFNGPTTLVYGGAGTLQTNVVAGDVFNDNMTYSLLAGSGAAYLANLGNTAYKKDLTFNCAKTSNLSSNKSDFGQNQASGEFISFTGTGDQHISVTGTFTNNLFFKNFKVDKPSGKLYVNKTIQCDGSLSLNSGIVVMSGEAAFYLTTISNLVASSKQSFVDGYFNSWLNASNYGLFPTGAGDKYAPIKVGMSTGNGTTVAARYYRESPGNSSTFKLSNCEYWQIWKPSSSGGSLYYSLIWDNEKTCSNIESSSIISCEQNPSTLNWSMSGNTVTGNNGVGYVTSNAAASPAYTTKTKLVLGYTALTSTVTQTSDNGTGSLRQAILDANLNPSVAKIVFTGLQGTIQLASPLPAFKYPIVLDGSTRPNYDPNNDQTWVQIQNAPSQNVIKGLTFSKNCEGSSIKGVKVSGFTSYGIDIQSEGVSLEKVKVE